MYIKKYCITAVFSDRIAVILCPQPLTYIAEFYIIKNMAFK